MSPIWEDMARSAVEKITALQAENQRLQAEVEQLRADLDLIFRVAGQYWVTKNALDDSGIKVKALTEELQAANLAHEQYREWAAGQIEHLENLRTEHLATIEALRRQMEQARAALEEVLASACPNAKEHPTMFAAWEKARRLL